MIKKEHLEVFFITCASASVQRALVNELAALRAQLEIDIFARTKLELPFKLVEMESILCFARLLIHARQEDTYTLNDLL